MLTVYMSLQAPEIRPESLLCTYIVALREGLSAPDALQEACAKWARTNKVCICMYAIEVHTLHVGPHLVIRSKVCQAT